jgi:hypothetical protein
MVDDKHGASAENQHQDHAENHLLYYGGAHDIRSR